LQGDTVRVIWAIHEHDPKFGGQMVYHGEKRGVQSIHLLGPQPVPNAASDNTKSWPVVLNNVS